MDYNKYFSVVVALVVAEVAKLGATITPFAVGKNLVLKSHTSSKFHCVYYC